MENNIFTRMLDQKILEGIMSGFLECAMRSSDTEKSWIDLPYFSGVFKQHLTFVCGFQFYAAGDKWTSLSHLDLAARVGLLLLNAAIACPLIALASLVEGTLRALSGGTLSLLAFIPFDGNKHLSVMGSNLLTSTRINGSICLGELLSMVMLVSLSIGVVVKRILDISGCKNRC